MDASSNTSYLEPMPIAVVVAIIVCVVAYLITRSASGGPQPKTKEELQKWIKEYCEGVKNHGEPNTWDVTRVTNMSSLFWNMKTFNAPIDQWNTSQVTNMRHMFCLASSFNHGEGTSILKGVWRQSILGSLFQTKFSPVFHTEKKLLY